METPTDSLRRAAAAGLLAAVALAAGCGASDPRASSDTAGVPDPTLPLPEATTSVPDEQPAGGSSPAPPEPEMLAAVESLGLQCRFQFGGIPVYTAGRALGNSLGSARASAELTDADVERLADEVIPRVDLTATAAQYLCQTPGDDLDLDKLAEGPDGLDQAFLDHLKERLEDPGEMNDLLSEIWADELVTTREQVLATALEGEYESSAGGSTRFDGPALHLVTVEGAPAWVSLKGEWTPEQVTALDGLVASHGAMRL